MKPDTHAMYTLRTLVALAMLGGARAADRYWAVGDGDWDTSSLNWMASNTSGNGTLAYADGDRVFFSGSDASNRQICNVNIVGSVAPAFLRVMAGYGCQAELSGGDITGTLDMQVDTQNGLRFLRAFSFSGTILANGTTGNNSANFYFVPTAPATLTQAIDVPADKGLRLYGNAAADWSGCSFTLGQNATLDNNQGTGVVSNYTGLVVQLLGDANFVLFYHYTDSSRGCFNGQFSGPDYVLTMSAPAQSSNRANYIVGPGNWDIGGLVFNYPGFRCYIRASNICGKALTLQDGIMDLAAGTEQRVEALSIAGVEQTAYGTYGSTASGADVVDNAHFAGTGVVRLVPPPGAPGTVLLVL